MQNLTLRQLQILHELASTAQIPASAAFEVGEVLRLLQAAIKDGQENRVEGNK